MKRNPKRQVGALVNIRWEMSGKWLPARIIEMDEQGFRAVPTGEPVKGWLGENVVLRAWENEYGAGGYDTWAWRKAVPDETR